MSLEIQKLPNGNPVNGVTDYIPVAQKQNDGSYKTIKTPASLGGAAAMGTATLNSGTITVNTTAVKSNSIIMVSMNTPDPNIGFTKLPPIMYSRIQDIVAGVSFIIYSMNATTGAQNNDNSTVNWVIFNP